VKAPGFIGFLMNTAHKKPGRHRTASRLFVTKFEVGDLVKLSPDEVNHLINDTGYSAAEISEWNVGIVLCYVPPGEGDFEDESYRVKWFPSGDIIEETDNMIAYMYAE